MVFFCGVTSDQRLGDRPGLRAKFYGEPWEAPYEQHATPLWSEKIISRMDRCIRGEVLPRQDFPEAFAVYDETRFKKMKSLFWVAGFLAVKQDLADIFSRFDMGQGGLVPFPIYQADETTLYPGSYYFLHFGNQKDTFVAEQSQKVFPSYFDKERNLQPWKVYPEADGDVVVTVRAEEGPNIWIEPTVPGKLFMSDGLAMALWEAKIKPKIDWQLTKCRIVDE
nr:hypothetical protein [uncultured Cohaesibacter sp.]